MKINSIKIDGFQAIREIEVTPNGNHIEVTGGNRRGKSTFFRAIFHVLTGKDLPDGVVNDESIKAKVVMGIDGHTVTWSCKKTGSPTLKVEREDGEPITGGDRTYLNKLIGSIGEDPLALASMSPSEQKAKIQKIMGLDFSDLDVAKTKNLADIKDASSKVKAYAQQLDQFGNISKVDPVDVSALLAKQAARNEAAESGRSLADAQKKANEAVDSVIDRIENQKARIDSLHAQIEAAEKELKFSETELTNNQAVLNLASQELDAAREAFKSMEDPTPAIASASDTNRKAQQWEQASGVQKLHEEAELALQVAKDAGEKIDSERVKRLTAVNFPVDGLEFTEDGILYKGRPFNENSQCTSDIMKVGLALQMVANPGMKVLRISRGSELDADSKALVLDIASEYGFQAIIETVTSGDVRAIVLESTPEITEGEIDA